MISFLANENFPSTSIQILRESGYPVLSVREDAPGLDDVSILAWATRDRHILLTQDRDYGELVFRYRLPAPQGIVFFRLDDAPPNRHALRLISILAGGALDLRGWFVIVKDDSERLVPIET